MRQVQQLFHLRLRRSVHLEKGGQGRLLFFDLMEIAIKSLSHQAGISMRDLKSPKLIWFKGILFLIIGLASAGLVWVEAPTLKTALLLAVSIWAFCRAYYFAFYVLEKYVDPHFRFAGLFSLVRYIRRGRGR